MSQLKSHEKTIFEKLFNRGGYVLNFNDKTFAAFFREHKIDINNQKYQINGSSKMNRLRAFWELEPDLVVGRVLEALLKYACEIEQVDQSKQAKALEIIARLQERASAKGKAEISEEDFLKRIFDQPDLSKLNLDSSLQVVIEQRISEIHKTLRVDSSLATIFLCGSTLEGLLLDVACKNAQQFNSANASPKDSNGKVLVLPNWTLANLIDVASEVGVLSLDIKKYSHSLRDFRNYIHPRHQVVQRFNPDKHTAEISWRVLQAALADLSGQRRKKS